jgi:transposase
VIENSSATAMLGLEGMAVLAVSERDGEVEYAIQTTASTGWCPVCGAAARLHNRRPTWVRDLPAGHRAVTLVWIKRVWRCTHVECEQQTWTETHPQIRARASWSERARKQACRRVGRDGHSVAAGARDVGVGWATVMAAVVDYGTAMIERAERVGAGSAVGVDETAFARANPIRSTVFATGIVDLHRGKLIDIIEGRSRKVLADWLIDQPAEWTAGIEVAALDPFRGYGAALSAGLPHAVRVLDAFHVVRLGFAAVDDVRRRVQQHTCGHRGRRDDPLYGIRRVLRRGAEHLTATGWARLLAGIEAGDHDGQVAGRLGRRPGTTRHLPLPRPRPGRHPPLRLDRDLYRLPRARAAMAGADPHDLEGRVLGLLQRRPDQQRAHRSRQPTDQENLRVVTDSETSTTTGYAYYCTAESPGNITPRHHYEAAYHAWLRRAR